MSVKLTEKEIKRASDDGFVIVSRPEKTNPGTYSVFAVDIYNLQIVGWTYNNVPKNEISNIVTQIQRDMDKFLGIGGKMSDAGRMRKGHKPQRLYKL